MKIGTLPALLALASLPVMLAVAPVAGAAAAAGADGATGHEQIKPFPGAKLVANSTHGFEEYWMPLGRLVGEAQAERYESLGGRWTHSTYTTPAGRSVAEVFRHYEQQLAQAGFEVVYACRGQECGEGGRKTNGDWWPLSDHRRFMAARLSRPQGDLWVSVHVYARAATTPIQHELDIVEAKPPATTPPPRSEADFATLARELKSDGRIVLRTVGFADQRPAVLPESEPVIGAIAELLARDPGLKLHVVVHSDNALPARAAVELTKKRAAALTAMLTRGHGIASGRLQPAGLGPLSPVASNRTEEGRAMNRRIELVPNDLAGDGDAAASVRR